MLKRTILAFAVAALALPSAGLLAQESATITLRSGEKVSAQLLDHGGVGFTVRVNGQERQIPTNDVAVIDFGGGDMTDADWARFTPDPLSVVEERSDDQRPSPEPSAAAAR